jgi:hypothetical protein
VSIWFNDLLGREEIIMQNNSNIITHSLDLKESGYVQCLVFNKFGSEQESSSLLQISTEVTSIPTQSVTTPSQTTNSPTSDTTSSQGCQTCTTSQTTVYVSGKPLL